MIQDDQADEGGLLASPRGRYPVSVDGDPHQLAGRADRCAGPIPALSAAPAAGSGWRPPTDRPGRGGAAGAHNPGRYR